MTAITAKRRPANPSFVRYTLGLSQQQLADNLGVSRSMVAMVETGKRKFPRSVANTHLNMCRAAEQVNPEGYIAIKRGRKAGKSEIGAVTKLEASPGEEKVVVMASLLEEKKKDLSYLHTGLKFRKKTWEDRAKKFSDELNLVTEMLKISAGLMRSLPEGKARDRQELKAAIFYAKQVKLKQQLKRYSPTEILMLEFKMNLLASQINILGTQIAALTVPLKD